MKIIVDVKSNLKTYRFEKLEWVQILEDCEIDGYIGVKARKY